MMQSYLVTKGEVRKLNADQQVFTWLVAVLDCAVRRRPWQGRTFAAIEVLKVQRSTCHAVVYQGFHFGGTSFNPFRGEKFERMPEK